MLKQLTTLTIIGVLISGCAMPSKPGLNYLEKNIPLENGVDNTAIPYLIKELGEQPRFKGKPFLFVNMNKEKVEAEIDNLTMQLREAMIDGILTKSGIELVWRPSTKQWEHHTSIKNVPCNRIKQEQFYIGIDSSLSSISGKLIIKLRALDAIGKKWISGFGISWQGQASSMQKMALSKKNPDGYLLGLRPLPFNKQQADLLAAYLSRNLSCLFSNMELNDVTVYVKKGNPDKIKYFDNTFNLISNYLARYREVTVTDDPSLANITVFIDAHNIHDGLFQVWMIAKYTKSGKYVPGRETGAYVILPMQEIKKQASKKKLSEKKVVKKHMNKYIKQSANQNVKMPVKQLNPKITAKPSIKPIKNPDKKTKASLLKTFGLCFYNYTDRFSNKIYPMLKTYPGVTDITRLYNSCNTNSSCVCYAINVKLEQYKKMEELILWLHQNLNERGVYLFELKPISEQSIKILFQNMYN